MEAFKTRLATATKNDDAPRKMLGALALITDRNGKVLYNHSAGRQTLAQDAPPLDPNSTLVLGSAGKFITHVAALQCVERGWIGLDDPVEAHLPELGELQVLSKEENGSEGSCPFVLRPPKTKITLRHLLTHSSGVGAGEEDCALMAEWQASEWHAVMEKKIPEDAHIIVKMFSEPLIFEPGQGYAYGWSIHWTSLLIARLSKTTMPVFVQENIFDPLGMSSSTYRLGERPDIEARLLRMVSREGETLVEDADAVQGLVCSAPDIVALLTDLMSDTPKVLKKANADLFAPTFFPPGSHTNTGTALSDIRADYCIPAGIPQGTKDAPVNYTCSGLLVEGELPLSGLPSGTVTWNGMPNVVWAMNKERGIGMVFATQLVPVDDPLVVEVMMEFFKGAWKTF